jgi:tRNA 2-selenouridine synthase
MSFSLCTTPEWLADRPGVDAIIDVRSPSEFAEDHLPGAVNWPVLNDEERARVGAIYKQVSTFEARKIGGAIASRRIAEILEQHVADKPRDWRPLVYCWRGGQRSGSLSLVLSQVGFRTRQLAGGYKGFRHQVRADLDAWPARFDWRVVSGRTGSGKTRLLAALARAGAQVLDLEDLAAHRGSVLGDLPDRPQPSQKHFDTLLWQAMATLDPARPVYVESESRKIGQRQVPEALLARMHATTQVLRVEMPMSGRLELLLEEYRSFTDNPTLLCQRLQTLVELRGRAVVSRWQELALSGQWDTLLPELMAEHYDPLYDRSTHGHYQGVAQTLPVVLPDGRPATLDAAVQALLQADASH